MSTQYSLDIISAAWGSFIVTEQVRKIYQQAAQQNPTSNVFSFVPNVNLFGDPNPGQPKSFVLVWRTTLGGSTGSVADNQTFSAPALATCLEGSSFQLNYDGTGLAPYSEPVDPPNGIYLLNATYWNKDVTSTVKTTISSFGTGTNPVQQPVNPSAFPVPPSPVVRQLVITYGYSLGNGTYEYNCIAAYDGSTLSIPYGPAPPRLLIQWADFGGWEFTDQVAALTTFNQTVTLDMTNWMKYGWADPWPGITKVMTVLYQWEGRGLELLIAPDQGGTFTLDPTVPVDPLRTSFFNPNGVRSAGKTNIIAIVWGKMQGLTVPVDANIFDWIAAYGVFQATNDFFGFDGWDGNKKVAQVFFQYGVTGEIQCTSARETDPGEKHINGRSVEFGDPLPARQLMTTFDPRVMSGFQLKALKSHLFIGVNKNGLLVPSTNDPTRAAMFNFVRNATDRPVIQAALTPADSTGPFYMYNNGGIVSLTADLATATEIHYELPSIGASTSVILSFAPSSTDRDPPVFAAGEGAAVISAPPLYAVPISDCLLEFSWVMASNREDLLNQVDGILAPCTIASFKLLKDMLWDLPQLITGATPVSSNKTVTSIVTWFSSLKAAPQSKVMQLLSVLQSTLSRVVGTSSSTSSVGISALWPVAIKIMKSLYDSDVLWSLYGFISKKLSWYDYLLIVGNLLKFVLMLVGSTAVPAAPAVFWATPGTMWAINTTKDIVGFIKACVPQGLSDDASRGLLALIMSVRKATDASAAFAQLMVGEQMDVTQALMNPHWHRIYLRGVSAPPKEHLIGSLHELRFQKPAGIPTDPALQEFLKHELSLTERAGAVVQQLRRGVENDLVKTGEPAGTATVAVT